MQTHLGEISQPAVGQTVWVVWSGVAGQYIYAGHTGTRHLLSRCPVEFGLSFEAYESPIFFAEESSAQAYILHRFLSQIKNQQPQIQASA